MSADTDMVDLKVCPFCGSRNVELRDPHGAFSRLAVVACDDCEIRGPLSINAEQAISAWNTRAALDASGIGEMVEALSECQDKLWVLHFSLIDKAEREAAINACNMATAALSRARATQSGEG